MKMGLSVFWKLFLVVLLCAIQPVCAEIYDIRLIMEGMRCPSCPQGVARAAEGIRGIDSITAFTFEDFIQIAWKQDVPFSANDLYRGFFKSQYKVREIDVDVEGIINKQRGAIFLFSQPDGSKFYILNTEAFRKLKDGERVRLQGMVSSQQNVNYLDIKHILPPEIE
jgi:hypothetical protein